MANSSCGSSSASIFSVRANLAYQLHPLSEAEVLDTPRLNFMDASGEAVKRAIRSEELEALELRNLERLGVRLDGGIGRDGFTPMHWACHYGRAKV